MLNNTIDAVPVAAGSRPTADAVFNRHAALARLDGDEELFAMLVSVFQQDCAQLLAQLAHAVAVDDLAVAERAAHSLKGLAANFDASHATQAALAVEELAQARRARELPSAVGDLELQLDKLSRALGPWAAR